MRLRDYNEDGQISEDEHQRYYMKRDDVSQTFHELADTEAGTISRAGYVELGDYHPYMEYLAAEDAFDRLDRDRDGKLTYQEAFEGNMLDY